MFARKHEGVYEETGADRLRGCIRGAPLAQPQAGRSLPACVRDGERGQEGNCRLPVLLQRRAASPMFLRGASHRTGAGEDVPPEQRGTKRKNTACPAGKRSNAMRTRLRVYTSVSHVVEHRSLEPSCSGLIEAGCLRANIAGIVRSARQLSQSLSADHSSGV